MNTRNQALVLSTENASKYEESGLELSSPQKKCSKKTYTKTFFFFKRQQGTIDKNEGKPANKKNLKKEEKKTVRI